MTVESRVHGKEVPHEKQLDINTPGLLVHGTDGESAIEILVNILNQGLIPRNEQQRPKKRETSHFPDYVSLSMVGTFGYEWTTTAFEWGAGAWDDTEQKGLTVVIDPRYVQEHSTEFTAVGEYFDPSCPSRHEYCTPDGQLFHNLGYKQFKKNLLGYGIEAQDDEVITPFVPSEAILAIITPVNLMLPVRNALIEHLPDRKILLVTPTIKC